MQRSYPLESTAIPLPVPHSLRQRVEALAQQETDPEKRSQLYRNLLAVGLVHHYMEMMQFPTDLAASDSWHPVLPHYADLADLNLPGLGHLECRLMAAGQNGCQIPAEVPDDRLGIIVVAMDHLEDNQARLLGFSRRVQPGWLAVERLQSMDDALAYLTELETQASAVPLTEQLVQLGDWLQGTLTTGWQTLEALLGAESPQLAYGYAFRQGDANPAASAQAGKLIELATTEGYLMVALVLATTRQPDGTVGLRVQLHPAPGAHTLPEHLTLSLLDSQGECLQTVPTRAADNFIQLPYFRCDPGEPFTLRLALGDSQITETFQA
jgi:hypothetical protein